MKIAVFIKKTTFHKGWGGLETQNLNLCEGLVSRGHSVTVFSPKLDVMKESENINGVDYQFISCSFRSLGGLAFLDKNNWVNKSVERFVELNDEKKFDIVLGQSSAALGLIRKKNELGIPVVSISHGTAGGEIKTRVQNLSGVGDWIRLIPDLAYFLINFFKRQREFVLNSNKIIAVSKIVKKLLTEETFVPDQKVEVIYNGMNLHGADSIPTSVEKELDVLYVGQIQVSKGLADLAKALKDKNYKVGIAGEGEFLEELKTLAPKFEYIGKVDSDQVLSLMRRAKIFVLPSRRWEGMPITLLEAAFMELPAVGTNMGGIPEVIEDSKTGFIYEVGNITQLQERISRLLSDGDLRAQMGSAAKVRAQEKFSLDKMLDGYEKVFQGVLK